MNEFQNLITDQIHFWHIKFGRPLTEANQPPSRL